MELRIIDSTAPLSTVDGLFWVRYQKPCSADGTPKVFYMLYKRIRWIRSKAFSTGFGLLVTPELWLARTPKSKLCPNPTEPTFYKISEPTIEKALANLMTEYLLLDVFSNFPVDKKAKELPNPQFGLEISEGLYGHKIILAFGAKPALMTQPFSGLLKGIWRVVMDWDPKTKQAWGFSQIQHRWDRERQSLEVYEPEDIASWALTMSCMFGLT